MPTARQPAVSRPAWRLHGDGHLHARTAVAAGLGSASAEPELLCCWAHADGPNPARPVRRTEAPAGCGRGDAMPPACPLHEDGQDRASPPGPWALLLTGNRLSLRRPVRPQRARGPGTPGHPIRGGGRGGSRPHRHPRPGRGRELCPAGQQPEPGGTWLCPDSFP